MAAMSGETNHSLYFIIGFERPLFMVPADQERVFFQVNWCGNCVALTLEGRPVWHTLHAELSSGLLPPWVSPNSLTLPPPAEVSWQLRQLPMAIAFAWYCSAW
jgi:hypothetical protein